MSWPQRGVLVVGSLLVVLALILTGDSPASASAGQVDPVPETPDGCPLEFEPYDVIEGWNPDMIRVACNPGRGYQWVECRDERDVLRFDGRGIAAVSSAPELAWFREEIQNETEADEGRGCALANREPQPLCSSFEVDGQLVVGDRRDAASQDDDEGYRSPGLIPDECWGTYPSANYDLAFNDGGKFDFDDRILGFTAGFMFTLGKGAIVAALWIMGWAFRFDITTYTEFASNIAGSYQDNFVATFGLEDIVWFFLVAWVGFTAMRGKLGAAGSELVVTIVLAGLATVLFDHRTEYLDSLAHAMDDTSANLLAAGRPTQCVPEEGQARRQQNSYVVDRTVKCSSGMVGMRRDSAQPADLDEEIRPLQRHIFQVFVEQPYAFINWGRIPTGHCLEVQNHIVAVGYHDDGWPQRYMDRVGCGNNKFIRDVTGDRVLAALLTMIVALVMGAFLALMALTVVVAKFLVALLFAVLPFAMLGAVLPSGGRRVAWSWIGTVIQLLAVVVLMTFLLTLTLVGVDEVLKGTEDVELVERWFVILLVVGAVFLGRRRLVSGAQNLGTDVSDTLGKMTSTGASWAGRAKGVDLGGIDRGAGLVGKAAATTAWWGAIGTGATIGAAATIGARSIGKRMSEARMGNRSLHNTLTQQLSYRYWNGQKFEQVSSGSRGGRGNAGPEVDVPGDIPAGGVLLGGHGSKPTYMLEPGMPQDLNLDNRKELRAAFKKIHGMPVIWDRGMRRFTHPIWTRRERNSHRNALAMQLRQQAESLAARRKLGDIPDGAKLFDRRGHPLDW